VTVNRQTLLWVAAALLGIVATATVAWSASRLAATNVGLAGAPVSVISGLAPTPTTTPRRTLLAAPKRHKPAHNPHHVPTQTAPAASSAPAPTLPTTTPPASSSAPRAVSPAPAATATQASPSTTPSGVPTTTTATQSKPQHHDDSSGGGGSGGGQQGRDD
jgi:hypothetical protein